MAFASAVEEGLKREQVNFLVAELLDDEVLERTGKGAMMKYMISSKFTGESPFD